MSNCIEFCCAHDVSQRIVISVDGELWSIEEIVSKCLTHCLLHNKELKFSAVKSVVLFHRCQSS